MKTEVYTFNNIEVFRDGKIKALKGGICEYTATGYFYDDNNDIINVTIGFNEYTCDDFTPVYLFVNKQITASGNHIEKETIDLFGYDVDIDIIEAI